MQLNPALTPGRGYINIPAIGSLNATVNSSSFGFQDIMDIIENSDGSDYFMSQDFLNRLDANNNLNVNLSTDIISAGWYKGKNFWSVNVGLRNDIGAEIPRTVFDFMNRMNTLTASDLQGMREQFGGQQLEINSFAEVGVGFARDINSRLTVGAKVKALLGIGNVKLDVSNVSVNSNLTGVNVDEYGNPYIGNPSQVTGEASIQATATLESSSKLLELQQGDDGYVDKLDFGSFGFAGYGLGIDLGASYRLLDNLTISASVLDLGFIKWGKGNTHVASANSTQRYDASNAQEFMDVITSGEVLNFDMLQMSTDPSAAESRTTSLISTVVVGAEYGLLNNWLVVGALYTGRFAKPKSLNELTFSANIRPKNYFNLAVSYSLLQGAGKTFGAAIKLGPLFVGTDYMFLGKNTKNVNAYLGISIPLGKQKTL